MKKILPVLKKLVPVLQVLPFNIGTVIKEFTQKNESPEGQLNRAQAMQHLFKFIIYIAILYMIYSKAITVDEAKGLITH